MVQTQKQRLEEAYQIHKRFHNWMGFLVCDGEEDMLALRKLVKKIEREARKELKEEISNLNGLLEDEGSWDHEMLYYDAYLGNFNGNSIGGTPDKKYAKWLAKRYGFKIGKDGDII